jgi:hypothetical protein
MLEDEIVKKKSLKKEKNKKAWINLVNPGWTLKLIIR